MPKRHSPPQRSIVVLERALEDAAQPIAITTPEARPEEARLVFVNRAFERLSGWRSETVVGRCCAELYDPAPDHAATPPGGKGEHEIALRPARRAAPRQVECLRAALFDRNGERRYWLIVHRPQARGAAPVSAGVEGQGGLVDELGHGVLVHRGLQAVYANRACARRLGVTSVAQLVDGPSLLRFLPLEVYARALEHDARLMAGAAPGRPRVVRYLTASGATFWAEVSEQLIDWQGERAVLVSLVDVSEQVRARATERLLREAIDNLSDSFILYNADDRVVLTNRRFHESFPYVAPQGQIVGTPMIELVRASVAAGAVTDPTLGQDAEAWIAAFIEARHRNAVALAEDTWPDGRWDLVKEQRLRSGGFVSVRTDITDRKRAEFALRDHEARLEQALAERTAQLSAILANIAQGVTVTDPDQRIVLTNQGFFDLYDYPAELAQPGTHISSYVRHRLRQGRYWPGERETGADLETLVARRVAQYRDLEHEVCEETLADGRVIEIRRQRLPDGSVVSTYTNVTDRIGAERELQRQREALYQSEKLAALGVLLAGVAHELNNPLTVVLGEAALMESLAQQPDQRERASRIRAAAERCARIIKIFLSMARGQAGARAAVQLNDLIEQALELVAYQLRTSSIEVVRELAPALPAIAGDPHQLSQVLVNLLVNAQQAMLAAGPPRRLTVATRHLLSEDRIELAVSDTGLGVPEAIRRRIFDPFFTTKPTGAGTGIGLTVCHGMVSAHGGSIAVDDAPGGGARFTVRLPCAGTGVGAGPAEPALDHSRGRSRILVVDDEADVRSFLAELLRIDGHEVTVAKSGKEALVRLAEQDYGAIICDLRMPEMDGPELYAALAHEHPWLLSRIIFTTGDVLSEPSRRFLEACQRPCLEKPFLPAQLRRLIEEVVLPAGSGPAPSGGAARV
ncbi:MAG TPA: PAS-domain containing protein [Geminicoccaceae bacterium]|nr:PAS-domain containing protein [Geminicoccaceae bacterium]